MQQMSGEAAATVTQETRLGKTSFRARPAVGPSVGKFESRGEAWGYLRSIGEQVPDSKPTAFAKSAPPTPSQAPAPAKQASGSTSPSHGDAGQSIGDGGAEGAAAASSADGEALGNWSRANHGRAPGFGGAVKEVAQCHACEVPLNEKGGVCSFCQNEMQRRGKRKLAHLADPSVNEETGLTYRMEIKVASLAKRARKPKSLQDPETMAAAVARHLLKMQQ